MNQRHLAKKSRLIHRKIVPIVSIPLLLIVVTGILLLLRREIPMSPRPEVKPSIHTTAIQDYKINLPALFASIQQVNPELHSIFEVKEIRIHPKKGTATIRLPDYQSIILDNQTGEILGRGTRWSSFLVGLHEGSYWSKWVSYLLYLPIALLFGVMLFTGIFLYLPFRNRGKREKSVSGHPIAIP